MATCHLVFLKNFGRKPVLFVFLLIAASVIALIPMFFVGYPTITTFLYLFAKYAINGAQLTCSLLTSDLYPTPIRSTGIGLSISLARVRGIFAPKINASSKSMGFYFPFMLFTEKKKKILLFFF